MNRRGLLGALGFLAAAPAIIRTPGLLMPIKPERNIDRIVRVQITERVVTYRPERVQLVIGGHVVCVLPGAVFEISLREHEPRRLA